MRTALLAALLICALTRCAPTASTPTTLTTPAPPTAASAPPPPPPHQPPNMPVRGAGCLTRGVEEGCVMLTDKDGKVWDLTQATPKPSPYAGKAVVFAGYTAKFSTCGQGTTVQKVSWNYVGTGCPIPPGAAK